MSGDPSPRPAGAAAAFLAATCLLGGSCGPAAPAPEGVPVVRDAPEGHAITAAGAPARLEIRRAGSRSVRVTVLPRSMPEFPANPALAPGAAAGAPVLAVTELDGVVSGRVGSLDVELRPAPLTVTVRAGERIIQELRFEDSGTVAFRVDDAPVLGLGGGGPSPEDGENWRASDVEFDRRGRYHPMDPRWQSGMYGSRNPAPMLVGTGGWGLFVAAPWVEVDLADMGWGRFVPWQDPGGAPPTREDQWQRTDKGKHPPEATPPGLFDVVVFDGADPASLMGDFSALTGPAALPPKWALGYMQSHRTLEDDAQLLEIIDTFREKEIPLDAVVYLGTGFCPVGWNTEQPSFEFNPAVFQREPAAVLADMEERHVRTVVHMVPWDRERLPTLRGTIPPAPGEVVDPGHIQPYWEEHGPLVEAGVDAFWPDEGDWYNLFERLKRHQMYYQGMLQARPETRPWHLQRNGFPGIARWGGWVWSGDTDSAWKSLEAQIAVGLNFSLSVGPFWGSDIGGFFANRELTGELYARWFQFGAFSPSFRAHGRTWWTRLPWGWGLDEMGPTEVNNSNTVRTEADRQRLPRASELGNPAIEPVAKRYAELRSRLLPYNYTVAWQARARGLPMMRALWLHYPDDARARAVGDAYLWGRDLLVAPVYRPGAVEWSTYLPAGLWYDWWSNQGVEGGVVVTRPVDLATLPLYVRAGAIIPLDPVRQYAEEPVDGLTTLRVYTGADGDFTLYDDDGLTQSYLDGQGSWTRITWDDGSRTLALEPATPDRGRALPIRRTFRVVLQPGGEERVVTYGGVPRSVAF